MAKDFKTRSRWNRAPSFALGDPIHKLAVYARDNDAIALALCDLRTPFDRALTKVLDDAPPNAQLEDLTDAERAFCAGWAYLARRKCGPVAQCIQDAIQAHLLASDDPGVLLAEGEEHVLNG